MLGNKSFIILGYIYQRKVFGDESQFFKNDNSDLPLIKNIFLIWIYPLLHVLLDPVYNQHLKMTKGICGAQFDKCREMYYDNNTVGTVH